MTTTSRAVCLNRISMIWINTAQVNTIQAAESLSYPRGTLINVGGSTAIVNEDIIDVVRAIRNAK